MKLPNQHLLSKAQRMMILMLCLIVSGSMAISQTLNVQGTVVPEPATVALAVVGLAGVIGRRRR